MKIFYLQRRTPKSTFLTTQKELRIHTEGLYLYCTREFTELKHNAIHVHLVSQKIHFFPHDRINYPSICTCESNF